MGRKNLPTFPMEKLPSPHLHALTSERNKPAESMGAGRAMRLGGGGRTWRRCLTLRRGKTASGGGEGGARGGYCRRGRGAIPPLGISGVWRWRSSPSPHKPIPSIIESEHQPPSTDLYLHPPLPKPTYLDRIPPPPQPNPFHNPPLPPPGSWTFPASPGGGVEGVPDGRQVVQLQV